MKEERCQKEERRRKDVRNLFSVKVPARAAKKTRDEANKGSSHLSSSGSQALTPPLLITNAAL